MTVTVLSQLEKYSDHRLKTEDKSTSGGWIDILNANRAADLSENPTLVQISHFCSNKASNDNTQPALMSHSLLDKIESSRQNPGFCQPQAFKSNTVNSKT